MSEIKSIVPLYYKNVEEFGAVYDSFEKSFCSAESLLADALDFQFPQTAWGEGLFKLEAVYNIFSDSINEDDDFRRKRIISRAAYNPPYNEFFLRQKLCSLAGLHNFTLESNCQRSEIYISFSFYNPVVYKEALFLLRDVVPAHICFLISLNLERIINTNLFTCLLTGVRKSFNITLN